MKFKKILTLGLFIFLQTPVLYLWGSAPQIFENFTQSFSYDKDVFSMSTKLDLSMFSGRFAKKDDSYNFAGSLFSENHLKHFPITIMAGNLSVGGLLSKLKDPSISSSTTDFLSNYSKPECITGILPSSVSFSNPISTFVELGYENDNSILENVRLNGAYTPKEKELSLSAKLTLTPTDKIKNTSTAAICFFNIEENTPNSWFTDIPFYKRDKIICLGFENETILDIFYGKFSLFSYETPFGNFENIYNLENKLETDNFKAEFASLVNNNKYIITRDNTKLAPFVQLKGNIQGNLFFGKDDSKKDYSLKTSATAYSKTKLLENETDFNFGLSSLFTSPFTTVCFEGNAKYTTTSSLKLYDPKSITLKLENLWKYNLPHFTPSICFSTKLTFSDFTSPPSQEYKINLNTNLLNEFFTTSISYSYNCKNHKISKKKLDFGFNINLEYKKIIILMKIGGQFDI